MHKEHLNLCKGCNLKQRWEKGVKMSSSVLGYQHRCPKEWPSPATQTISSTIPQTRCCTLTVQKLWALDGLVVHQMVALDDSPTVTNTRSEVSIGTAKSSIAHWSIPFHTPLQTPWSWSSWLYFFNEFNGEYNTSGVNHEINTLITSLYVSGQPLIILVSTIICTHVWRVL